MKTKLSSILLVVLVTFLTTIAQILYKSGAQDLEFNLIALLTNYSLILGLFLYGIGAAILIFALKGGDLSVLYPIISTSYIWVAILSYLLFNESLNLYRWLGIFTIIIGTILLTTSKSAVDLVDPL